MSFKQKPLIAAMLLAISSTPSFSQSNNELQAITIYGSRFQEAIDQALPQTSIITSTEIQKSGLSNISEVLSKLGNLPTRQNLDGSTNAVIDMGGFGGTADNNVVVLLDGIRLSENEQSSARTSFIPLEAIDHIEITRGGNSVLYGDGATGGSINIITKKNTGNLTAVSAGLASYSGYQSNIYHSTDLGHQKLSVFARQQYSDGYRTNSNTSEQSAGLNLTSQIDSSSLIGVRVIGSQENNKLPGALPMSYLNTAPRNAQVEGYASNMHVKTSNLTIFGSKQIENVELGIDVNQTLKNSRWSYNYNASSIYDGYNSNLYPNQSPIAWGNTNNHSTTQHINPRAKVTDFLLAGNNLVLGYDWLTYKHAGDAYKTDSDSSYFSFPYGTSYNINDGSYGDKSFKTKAWYARSDWQVNPSDRFVVGIRRQSYEQMSSQNYYNGGNTSSCSPACDSITQWSFNNQGHASAYETEWVRKYTKSFSSYLRFSQNFRFANLDDNAQAYAQNNNLVPQTSHDYEIGSKWDASSLKIDARVFKSFVKNEIGFDGYYNVNYNPTRHQGIETNAQYQLSQNYLIKGNIHFVEAKFSEGAYSGKYIPNVSKLNGQLGIEHNLNFKETIGIYGRFAGNSFASNDLLNTQYKNPGYTIADLRYVYLEKKWSITANINNLLGKNHTDTSIYKASYTDLYKMTTYPNSGRSFSINGRYVF